METQSDKETPPDTDENNSLGVKVGYFELQAKGKKVISQLFRYVFRYGSVLLVILFMFQDEIGVQYNKYAHSEKYSQNQLFLNHHKDVKRIIIAWDSIVDIEDRSKKNVLFIRANIDKNLARYGKLKVNLLSESNQITWMFHKARLKIIEADITSDRDAIAKALALLAKARDKSNDTDKLTPNDSVFLNSIGIHKLIRRTSLNAYALMFHISNDSAYYKLADDILKDIGGCKELSSTYFYHKKISNALKCNI